MSGYTVKEGVILWLTPQLREILDLLLPIWDAFHIPFVITSGLDGAHGTASLHYAGRAIDIRTVFADHLAAIAWDQHKENIISAIVDRKRLCPYLQFELERDHLHIEYDRKGVKP